MARGGDARTRVRRGAGVLALGAALVVGTSGCAWIARVSVSDTGAAADVVTPTSSLPSISADGRYVAFDSYAGTLAPTAEDGGVFVRDTRAGTTEPVSIRLDGSVDDFADAPSISGDGRLVAYVSDGDGIIAGGNDRFSQVYLRDRVTHVTSRVSTKPNGNQGTDDSGSPSISRNGRWVAFESDSGGFVTNDTNESTDVFVRDLQTGTNRRVTVDAAGNQIDDGGDSPSIDGDGGVVAFVTDEQLVAADTNVWDDVYVRNLTTNALTLVSGGLGGAAANNPEREPGDQCGRQARHVHLPGHEPRRRRGWQRGVGTSSSATSRPARPPGCRRTRPAARRTAWAATRRSAVTAAS